MPQEPFALRRPPRSQARDTFDGWVVLMPEALADYRETYLPEVTGEAYSVESLASAEQVLLENLDDQGCVFGTMRYLGETILRTAGGRWEWEELWETSAPGAGLPFVRVDGPAGQLTGRPVNLFQTCSLAGAQQTGMVFTELLSSIMDSFGATGPFRRSSGIPRNVTTPEQVFPAMTAFLPDGALRRPELEDS